MADIDDMTDRGEQVSLMEPMRIPETSPARGKLTDLAFELAEKSAGFRRSLPDAIYKALSDLVRSMNCYYSNLIEGHDTHPVDIERALKEDFSDNPRQRDLQLEAKAHIEVQKWIDEGGLTGRELTADGIKEIHRRFCELLPEELLYAEDPDSGERWRAEPGEFRQHDVKIGQHVPISPGALPRFLERLEAAYNRLGKSDSILAAAAAHHRFLWIHPFLDGNGRVARLMSHAQLLKSLDSGGVWSIARGLARNEAAYKRHLIRCDQGRSDDLDGRGNLSEKALVDFTEFFLQTCIDQVDFMEGLVEPKRLQTRIQMWAEEEIRMEALPKKSGLILEAILYRGELPRNEVAGVVGTGDRQARRIVNALAKYAVIASDSRKAPLRLAFPASLADRWMPGLFPEKAF